jgi:GPH family glycoside/pentoside/hexuronide:cation symporter
MILFGVLPAFFCKERVHKQQKISLIEATKTTLKNKPFLIVCGIIIFTIVGVFVAIPLQYYLNMAYIIPGDEDSTSKFVMYGSYVYGIMGFLSVPLINYCSRIYGKKKTLMCGLSIVILGMLSSWLYYTPGNPYLQLIFGIIVSPGMSCAWVILPALIADICDMDELTTGRRREGMYGAVFSMLMKAGLSLTMVASGYVVSWTGYNSEMGIQAEHTIFRLRFMIAFVPAVFLVSALLFVFKYPLTRQKVYEIQSSLKKLNNSN